MLRPVHCVVSARFPENECGHGAKGLSSFSMVDVMYWPIPGANTACLHSGTDAGVNSAVATIPPSNNSISTTIGPDGFTYTSPSIYVAYHDISASNSCGQVGSKHTSITLSFQPGQLSTIDYSPGLFGFGGNPGKPKSFDLKNLPCPPQSLIDAQESANQPGLSLPARGTYAPIIAPPPAIQSLDPAWKTCVSFYAFDPPKTLAPAVAMVPSPTPAKQADPQITPAMPRPTVDGPPVQTITTGAMVAVDQPSKVTDPKNAVDPTTTAHSMIAADPNIHSVDNVLSVSSTQDLSPIPDPSNKPTVPSANPSIDVPLGSELVAGSSTVKIPSGSSNSVFTAAGHAFTPQPDSGVIVVGNTLSVNGPAVTVSGTALSLLSSGLVIGSQTFTVPTPSIDPKTSASTSTAFTMGGHTVTPLGDSSVIVQGATLSVGGPATTISGIGLSLASSALVIGTQVFAVPTPAPNPKTSPSNAFTMGGHIVTPLGDSSVIVQGATLSINGPATTISGTALSLAPSGVVIGSQLFAVPTSALGTSRDIVVIDGTTLTAGSPVVTIAGTPISLAAGTAGLYVTGLGPGSTAFSAPVIAGESISVDPPGQIAVNGKTVSGSGAGGGGLGPAIMLGFGAASSAAKPSPTGGDSGSISGMGSTASGVIGFTGEGKKSVDMPMMAILLSILTFTGCHIWSLITL